MDSIRILSKLRNIHKKRSDSTRQSGPLSFLDVLMAKIISHKAQQLFAMRIS